MADRVEALPFNRPFDHELSRVIPRNLKTRSVIIGAGMT
jgi:hypothetical protein